MKVFTINFCNEPIHLLETNNGYYDVEPNKISIPTYQYASNSDLRNDIRRTYEACLSDGYNPAIYCFVDEVNKSCGICGLNPNRKVKVFVNEKEKTC
jgi:hypothetical protein